MIKFVQDLLEKTRKLPSSTIVVNGQQFSGRSVNVVNGKVIVDGKQVDVPDSKEIHITVEGDLGNLQLDSGSVTVTGHAGDVTVGQGSVHVGMDVKGKIKVDQGKVDCQDVFANVSVDMGNVKAREIHGNATTKMGNISK